jgi:ABC-type Fe3+/spermidine/putrescine transport system ATPase subunit
VVSLAIRPERVVVGDAGALANVIKGTVVETFYTGDQTVVVVETDDGLRVTVKETNVGGETRRRAGDPLTVGWAPEQATLLSQ